MSFAKRLREAWRKGREREKDFPPVLQWQMRLKLAKQFHQGVSDEPPGGQVISNQSGTVISEQQPERRAQ